MKHIRDIIFESFLLLEYDRDKTIKQHGEKALNVALNRTDMDSYLSDVHGLYHGNRVNSKEGDNRTKAMNELIGQFEEADPTPQKKYVQHIARIYGNGGINRHEDVFARMKPALRDFHDLATRKILPAGKRDIGRYKSLEDIEDAVDAHKGQESGKQISKSWSEKMKSPEHASITEHDDFTHVIPHTSDASKFWGKGTKWCTAGDENNMHDAYSKNGPLQIYIPKYPEHPGEKYQYHYSSDQLMNEKDRPVELTNHLNIDNHVAQYKMEADSAHQTRAGFDHPEAMVRRRTLHKHWDTATEDEVGKVVEKGLYGAYEEDHHQEYHPDMGKSPLDHPNFTEQHLDHVINHPDWEVKTSAMWSPLFNRRHIDNLVHDVHPEKMGEEEYHGSHHPGEMRNELFRKTKNPEHFEQAFKTMDKKNEDTDAIQGMAFNPNTPQQMLSKMIAHPRHALYAVQNKNAKQEDVEWAAKNHPSEGARKNAEHALERREKNKTKKNLSQIIWHGK